MAVAPPQRIVSLVPSHTESLHGLGLADRVVGRTRFCVHPEPWVSTVPTVGGTKDAKLERILELRPDLVVADKDENPKALVEALGAAGVDVLWSDIATVQDACAFLTRLGERCGAQSSAAAHVAAIEDTLAVVRAAAPRPAIPVFCPIWHRPWMTFTGGAYPSAMLAAVGFRNVLADHAGPKYFPVEEPEVRAARPQWTLLPTEPFPFHSHSVETRGLGPAGSALRVRVIDGEALTWFGTRTEHGLRTLAQTAASLGPG